MSIDHGGYNGAVASIQKYPCLTKLVMALVQWGEPRLTHPGARGGQLS
jgi:hypothetical protein